MSKAYLNVKNFNFKEMMNLVCYGHKFPATLSHSQRLTRLYRACLRKQNLMELEALQGDVYKHFDMVHIISRDFYKLMNMNISYGSLDHGELIEFNLLQKKWEKWQEDNFEAHGFVDECRPYSPTSGRYPIFSDEQLSFDPFGYYSPRLLSDNRPNEHLPFFEDYPMNDNSWILSEPIPEGMSDSFLEKEHLDK